MSHPDEKDFLRRSQVCWLNKQWLGLLLMTRKTALEKSANADWQWQPLSLLAHSDASNIHRGTALFASLTG